MTSGFPKENCAKRREFLWAVLFLLKFPPRFQIQLNLLRLMDPQLFSHFLEAVHPQLASVSYKNPFEAKSV